MRAVIQRVTKAQVTVDDHIVGSIGFGLLVLLGVHKDDTNQDLSWLVNKVINLRVFEDDTGKMNLSLLDIKAEMLVVSQFTLVGDCRKGRRPSWSHAAPPEMANSFYEKFIKTVRQANIAVETGIFQAMMEVLLVNSGPVTLLLDSHKSF